jgi:hypothetical protein
MIVCDKGDRKINLSGTAIIETILPSQAIAWGGFFITKIWFKLILENVEKLMEERK